MDLPCPTPLLTKASTATVDTPLRQAWSVWSIWLIWFILFIRLISFHPKPDNETDQTNQITVFIFLADFLSILLLLCSTDGEYHPLHATHLDAYRPARRPLLHRSQYHPAHPDYHGGRPNRMDALSPRVSYRARGTRADRMELDRHGLRHLWNGGFGLRPCHSHEHPGRTRRDRRPLPLQFDERDRELFTDPVRRARIFAFVPGIRASNIPPSQSSVPFFIRKILIRSNPASISQALASAAL